MSRVISKSSPPFKPFEAGNKSGGRKPGARNRIQNAFLEDLQKDWQEHGQAAIRIMRMEKPSEYVKVVSTLLPRFDPEGLPEGGLTVIIRKFGEHFEEAAPVLKVIGDD